MDSMVVALINKKRHEAAGDLIGRWVLIDGKVSPELQRRRAEEKRLFKGELDLDCRN